MAKAKSPDAFRTISEVAAEVGVEQHVLRFWETKFPAIKPVKRAGGRRYYRPADVELLGGIRLLLKDDMVSIKGVQRIFSEKGAPHVAALPAERGLGPDGGPAETSALAPAPAAELGASPEPAPLPAGDVPPETVETVRGPAPAEDEMPADLPFAPSAAEGLPPETEHQAPPAEDDLPADLSLDPAPAGPAIGGLAARADLADVRAWLAEARALRDRLAA